MFLCRLENMAVFSLEITRIFEPSVAMYISIMEYYPNAKSRVNLNINSWACLWCIICVRIIITLQHSVGATSKHWLLGDWQSPKPLGDMTWRGSFGVLKSNPWVVSKYMVQISSCAAACAPLGKYVSGHVIFCLSIAPKKCKWRHANYGLFRVQPRA